MKSELILGVAAAREERSFTLQDKNITTNTTRLSDIAANFCGDHTTSWGYVQRWRPSQSPTLTRRKCSETNNAGSQMIQPVPWFTERMELVIGGNIDCKLFSGR